MENLKTRTTGLFLSFMSLCSKYRNSELSLYVMDKAAQASVVLHTKITIHGSNTRTYSIPHFLCLSRARDDTVKTSCANRQKMPLLSR